MYLQLADNENTPVAYQAIQTSHGTVYVRPDYPMLSAGKVKMAINKGVSKVLPKAAALYSATGLPYSSQVSKGANIVAAKAASGQPLLPPKVAATIKAAAAKTVGKVKANVQARKAAKNAPAPSNAPSNAPAPESTPDVKQNAILQFWENYKKPILITSSALAVGGITYAIIKNKRKKK